MVVTQIPGGAVFMYISSAAPNKRSLVTINGLTNDNLYLSHDWTGSCDSISFPLSGK